MAILNSLHREGITKVTRRPILRKMGHEPPGHVEDREFQQQGQQAQRL